MTDNSEEPVRSVAEPVGGDPGWALCLSGGGFRATLFHLGAVLRLNELGVLAKLSTITSVSGGSILNGVLATRWPHLTRDANGVFTNLEEEVARPVRAFCGQDLRTPILLGTRLHPGNWGALIRDWFSVSANFLADGYEPLYRQRLAEVPAPGPQTPRFVFCATNVRTGACWHFHAGPKARMGDFYAGYCDAGDVRVSDAVAASSAFPPGFSAFRFSVSDRPFSRSDPWGQEQVLSAKRGGEHQPTVRSPLLLTDGGVYDNLAVEPVWKTYKALLVSDAGRPFEGVAESHQAILTRLKRVADISMEQVASVRKRWLVEDYLAGRRSGAIWALHTRLEDFPLVDARGYGAPARGLLHKVRTDLDAFTDAEIGCVVNHGYSMADAALRSRAPQLCPHLAAPFRWPHDAFCEDAHVTTGLARSSRRRIWRDAFRYLFGRSTR